MASPTPQEKISGLTDPAILLSLAIISYVQVLIKALIGRNQPLATIRDDAFAQFWGWINPPKDPNEPLVGSAAVIEQLLPSAQGIVLELGPGSGDQIHCMKPARDRISKIYGAEPCLPLHKTLLANAEAAGFGAESKVKYEIVTASAERDSLLGGLEKAGLLVGGGKGDKEGSAGATGLLDTIVCVRVLCSVENQAETCATLYSLLKPGGKLLFCEHVVNPWRTPKGSLLARILQTVYSLVGWSFFVGGCQLTRNTAQVLIDTPKAVSQNGSGSNKRAWSEIQVETHFGWSALPYTSGILTK